MGTVTSSEKMKAAKPFKPPKLIGAAVDQYYELNKARLTADKVAADLKVKENQFKEYLIKRLPELQAESAGGSLATVTLKKKTRKMVEDWDKLYAYIAKTKSWDMLQRRVSDAAIEARIADGKKVPGVVDYGYMSLSLNKRAGG